ncbi:MAG: GHKL domain-containing protein [Phycisphaerae bacterium]|nr:GHKL domain-containing protein [Phycisphaerae bacterium]
MKRHDKLHLDALEYSIAQSFQAGIISFDRHLKVIDHTPAVEKLVDLQPTIHQTLSLGTDPNIWDNWQETLASVLETGRQIDFGVVKYTQADTSRLLHISCIPVTDTKTPHALGAAAILIDVTDKLEAEHEMAQAERLMAIGKIAGKVAHELNNPLDGILRYVNLTLRILDQNQPEKAKEYLSHCRTGLQRMVQIITEMLEFSRSANQAFETSPIDKLLDDAIRAMESPLRQIEVQIIRSETGPLPHVKSDSLFQVFCNLIKNACDAMPEKGKLTITVTRTEHDCRIEFRDTGHGFDPEKTDDLFKPFFTTKPKGRGTGLGLAICKDILEKLNGTIHAQNHPEGGASFTIQLSCTQRPVSSIK